MFAVIMLTMMIPGQVLYVPLFTMIARAGQHPARWCCPLANAVRHLPDAAEHAGVSKRPIEAARIDGYGEIHLLSAS